MILHEAVHLQGYVYMTFEVLTAAKMSMLVFWVATRVGL
jgi:hypothetical protein